MYNMSKYFHPVALFGGSINIYTKEVFVSVMSSSGCSHFGLLFTNEEHKEFHLCLFSTCACKQFLGREAKVDV